MPILVQLRLGSVYVLACPDMSCHVVHWFLPQAREIALPARSLESTDLDVTKGPSWQTMPVRVNSV